MVQVSKIALFNLQIIQKNYKVGGKDSDVLGCTAIFNGVRFKFTAHFRDESMVDVTGSAETPCSF